MRTIKVHSFKRTTYTKSNLISSQPGTLMVPWYRSKTTTNQSSAKHSSKKKKKNRSVRSFNINISKHTALNIDKARKAWRTNAVYIRLSLRKKKNINPPIKNENKHTKKNLQRRVELFNSSHSQYVYPTCFIRYYVKSFFFFVEEKEEEAIYNLVVC